LRFQYGPRFSGEFATCCCTRITLCVKHVATMERSKQFHSYLAVQRFLGLL
jgi:hypothetical protein